MTPPLDVWLYRRRAGRLEHVGRALRFTYGSDYVHDGGPPLSRSLPVREEPFETIPTHSFFANLLPESGVRRQIARQLGISEENDFDMLAALGGDCAGAVALLPMGSPPPPEPQRRVIWLDDEDLAQALAELPRRPLHMDPDEGIRLSLAGAQDKLPVVVEDKRIGIPAAGTPSTHILKTPIERVEHTVANEAFCLTLARELGLDAAPATVGRAGGRPFLLVERYDRNRAGPRVERIHQEDLCQALAVPPERKYEAEGGPGLADCFAVVRDTVDVPARDIAALVDAVALNVAIGNHDAHAKNFSLLYAPDQNRLAPLYDLVSTAVYPELDRKLAMKIGGENRPDYLRRRHLDRFARSAQLGPAAVRRRIARIAVAAPAAAADLAQRFAEDGPQPVTVAGPLLADIAETVARRSAMLTRELA